MNFDRLQTQLHYAVRATVDELVDLSNNRDSTPDEKRARKDEILARFRTNLATQQATRGFEIDARDSNRQTPLMYAITQPDILEILLQAGANPNLADINQHTPLHMLANLRFLDPEPYLALIAHGADIKAKRGDRYRGELTPLDDYLHETRPAEEGGPPRRRNPMIVELLTTPIPEANRRFALTRYRTWLRRRQAIKGYHTASTGVSGGRLKHTRRHRRTTRRQRRTTRRT